MTTKQADLYELKATEDAGAAGGALLDTWGQTDLAALDPLQYAQFIRAVIAAYGDSLREQIAGLKAPF